MSTEQNQKMTTILNTASGLALTTMDEMWRFATAVSLSHFAPKGLESKENIFIALQFGAEIGLSPMQSLQSLAIINGRPAIFGDAALALVRASGKLAFYHQSLSGEGDARKAVVKVQRVGDEPLISEFSVKDAQLAGLWKKAGTWTQYPDRMLVFRARGWALRDAFGDVLKGLATSEEVGDMNEINVTPKNIKPIESFAPPVKSSLDPKKFEKTMTSMGDLPMDDSAVKETSSEDRLRLTAAEYGMSEADVLKQMGKLGKAPKSAQSFNDLLDASQDWLAKNWETLVSQKTE